MAFTLASVEELRQSVNNYLNPNPYNRDTSIRPDLGPTNTKSEELLNIGKEQDAKNAAAKAKERNGYKFYYYPNELGSTAIEDVKRYPHVMMIFINVNSKSTKGNAKNKDKNITEKTFDTGTNLDLRYRTANQGVVTGSSRGGPVSGNAATEAVFTEEIFANYNRFTSCIMLPLPLNIGASYSMSYGEGGVSGPLGAAIAAAATSGPYADDANFGTWTNLGMDRLAKVGIGSLSNIALKNVVKLDNNSVLKNVKISDLVGNINNAKGLYDKARGHIENPRTEQLFRGVNFRTWDFSWNIAIRSVQEWENIKKIVSMLKEHMHPEREAEGGGSFLVMPDEFDIDFYQRTGVDQLVESKDLPRIATSVLESLSVSYTPQGNWVAFEGTMIPPFVQISTKFKELEPLHRGMVRDVAEEGDNINDRRLGF